MANREINRKHYQYYDALEVIRQSGITNMWGAAPYLKEIFPELSRDEATDILLTWIDNYEEICTERGWRTLI